MCPPPASARVLGVLRDHRARQRRRVLERAPHHARGVDAGAVVGEDPHAERVELAHRRELAPGAALRDAPAAWTSHARPRAGGEHRGDHGRVVVRRCRVRHRDDRGEAAERSGARAGLDRLRLLHPGLAEVHVQVDEPGRDHAAGGVELTVAAEPGADLDDPAVGDEHVGVALAGLVDDAAAADHERVRQPALPTRAARTARPCAPRRRSRPAR